MTYEQIDALSDKAEKALKELSAGMKSFDPKVLEEPGKGWYVEPPDGDVPAMYFTTETDAQNAMKIARPALRSLMTLSLIESIADTILD